MNAFAESTPLGLPADFASAEHGESAIHPAEQLLWHHACSWAENSTRAVPGVTAINEAVGPCTKNGEQRVRYSIRIAPDRFGRPHARRLTLDGLRHHPRPTALVRHAHALLDRVDQAVQATSPLHSHDPAALRRLPRRQLHGASCALFTGTGRAVGLELEYQIWIDATRGFARRVDYRARGQADGTNHDIPASVVGVRRYRVSGDLWLLTRQAERITFWTHLPDLPARGQVERAMEFSEHWLPAPLAAVVPSA